jgi:hypothetical protein
MSNPILAAMVTLVLWTLVMLIWLYATRIPAISKYNIRLDPGQTKDAFHDQFPPSIRWKSDNYAHLLEQPTLFYAVVLLLAVLGEGHGLNAALAWVYVGLRVAHSLVHVTVNEIMVRFSVFVAGSLVLLALAIRAALLAF